MADVFDVLDGTGAHIKKAAKDKGAAGFADFVVQADGDNATAGARADAPWDGVAANPTFMALAKFIANGLLDNTTSSPTSDTGAVVGASFTRPANTTQYSPGDHVANNGAIVPINIPNASRKDGGSGWITGLRMTKSTPNRTAALFRVHLFRGTAGAASIITPNVDNAAFSVNGVAAVHIGYIDVNVDQVFTDGAKGASAPARNVLGYVTNGGTSLFALVEALDVYAPGSAEVFTIALEITLGI
jgi:hypothetical protein